MKTKAFLLLCLFLGIGLTQLSAQNKKGTGSVVSVEKFETGLFAEPVFSTDGQVVDWLNGPITAHYVWHYKNGVWVSEIAHFYGELTSDATGEVFSIDDHYKTREVGVNGNGHYIAKGNKGTVLNIFYHLEIFWSGEPFNSDFLGIEYTLVKAIKQ
jgi:hypothetical protein